MLDEYRLIEIILMKYPNHPHRYIYSIHHTEHVNPIATGYGHDQEDAWQKAVKARNYIQKYGIDSYRL